jgi:hypothetical protein
MWDTRNGNWYTEYWDVDQQSNLGWHNIFVSQNGVDYEYESVFRWDADMMRNNGTPSEGHALSFGLIVNDNDGAFGMEGQLRQGQAAGAIKTDGTSNEPIYKATLSGLAGIAPVRGTAISVKASKAMQQASYDVLGRRIATNASVRTHGIRFMLGADKKAVQNTVVR